MSRSRLALIAAASWSLSGLVAVVAHAQLIELQDSVFVNRIEPNSGDTLPVEKFAAAFVVQNLYDSTTVQYTLTELRSAGQKLYLEGWRFDSVQSNWDAATMTDSSRTADFLVRANDTVTFYRDFGWWNFADGQFDTTLIIADTLDFAVELVRADNRSRFALLDSMGVNRRNTRGLPSYHGNSPAMRKVEYKIPAALDSTDVYIRLRVYTRGDGGHLPVRIDTYTVGASDRLTSSAWSGYRSVFNYSFAKRNVQELEEQLGAVAAGCVLNVAPTVTNGPVRITYHLPDNLSNATVTIYDAGGKEICLPMANEPTTNGSVEYVFGESGNYFVVLYSRGRQLAVTRVNVR
jgi:hypothetical protein